MTQQNDSPEYIFGRDGVLVGQDLDALSADELQAIQSCASFLLINANHILRFTNRVTELGRSGLDTVITLIDVDEPSGKGGLVAELLMPGHNWQQYRDRGEVPIARGLASKDGFPEILTELGYANAARHLSGTDELSVVVLHAGTAQVMEVAIEPTDFSS